MRYFKEVLVDATKPLVAIEGKLPAGAPKLSKILVDAANRLPTGPGFPIDIPEMPVPKLPTLPGLPGAGQLGGLAPRPTGSRGKISTGSPTATVGSRGKL